MLSSTSLYDVVMWPQRAASLVGLRIYFKKKIKLDNNCGFINVLCKSEWSEWTKNTIRQKYWLILKWLNSLGRAVHQYFQNKTHWENIWIWFECFKVQMLCVRCTNIILTVSSQFVFAAVVSLKITMEYTESEADAFVLW